MGQVTISLNGRSYRLRCGDGEEARLSELAADVGRRIETLAVQFGQVGDERLLVMAALLATDELWDARARLAEAEVVAEVPAKKARPEAVAKAATPPVAVIDPAPGPSEPGAASIGIASPSPASPSPANPADPTLKRTLRRPIAPTLAPVRGSLEDRLAEARDGTAPVERKTGSD